jgi:uroporphyrin-III C-methyltransferase/precorrin-2 dehydrogenase/sirohydrochlorin ferrochelatase
VSLTHRRLARRVQYVTGHGADGRLPGDLDWTSIADPMTTTVVYMPKRTLAELTATAQARGLPADTPAVAVVAATQPDQEVITGTIADIAARLDTAAPERPVLVMIGRALAQASAERPRATEDPPISRPVLPPRLPASNAPSRPHNC